MYKVRSAKGIHVVKNSPRVVGALYITFLASSHFVLQQLWDKLCLAFSLN